MAIEIVSFPIKDGDFPVRKLLKLPEGISYLLSISWGNIDLPPQPHDWFRRDPKVMTIDPRKVGCKKHRIYVGTAPMLCLLVGILLMN